MFFFANLKNIVLREHSLPNQCIPRPHHYLTTAVCYHTRASKGVIKSNWQTRGQTNFHNLHVAWDKQKHKRPSFLGNITSHKFQYRFKQCPMSLYGSQYSLIGLRQFKYNYVNFCSDLVRPINVP